MASTKSKLAGLRIDFSPTLALSNLSPLLCRLIFHIRSPPDTTPLLVFINPKSGGNQVGARVPLNTRLFPRARIPHHSSNPLLFFQGVKLMSQFQWLINPRQVFNLMARDTPDDKPQGPNVVCPWPVHNMFSFPLPLFSQPHKHNTNNTNNTLSGPGAVQRCGEPAHPRVRRRRHRGLGAGDAGQDGSGRPQHPRWHSAPRHR